MQAVVICTGLACGALLAAVGLALWGSLRQVVGLSYAVQAIRWLAGALLLIGALFAWQGNHSLSAPASRLILMAAPAALPQIRRGRNSPWDNVILILPSLVLAGAALFGSLEPVGTKVGRTTVTPVELAAIICGGLGARALGEGLSEIITSTSQGEGPSAATYALLTLLAGGTVLINLWQRGSVWNFVELSRDGGTTDEGGLAGAWLAWSAAWLSPRQPPRLRAVLVVVAALLLISITLK